MRTVSEILKYATLHASVENYFIISISGESEDIENDEIVSESLKLSQTICDDSDLKFGGCIASLFEIEITRNIDITGKEITVSLNQTAVIPTYPTDPEETGINSIVTYPIDPNLRGEFVTYPGFTVYPQDPICIFKGTVYSCKLSKNRIIRKIVAYDDFYWKGNIDCTRWYQLLYNDSSNWSSDNPNNPKITLGTLRLKILQKFKIVQAENGSCDSLVTLPADNIPVCMIEGSVTVGELLRQILEINGCFGFMNGYGQLEYITISGAYTEDNTEMYEYYIDIETEDFTKKRYTGLCITGFEDGKGLYVIVPENERTEDEIKNGINYYFADDNNIITKGYKASEFSPYMSADYMGNDNLSQFKENFNIKYTPLELKSELRSWVEVGDKIAVHVMWRDINYENHYKDFESIVLSRTLSGIQSVTDEISASGENIRYTEDYFDNSNE
jgi:hypothetical protein